MKIFYRAVFIGLVLAFFSVSFFSVTAYAAALPVPNVGINIGATDNPQSVVSSLQIIFLLASITLIPTFLLMLTSFTRIIIFLHFIRSAIGTQQMPPNQILLGLALSLTLFIMGPRLATINETALQPYSQGVISQEEAINNALAPIREFMLLQIQVSDSGKKDLALFAGLNGDTTYANVEEIPTRVIVPAFILNELTQGFIMGFIIYLPFIIVDMVVASTLMAMGMMMLPPAMISLPFKILIFILADGWNLVIRALLSTIKMSA